MFRNSRFWCAFHHNSMRSRWIFDIFDYLNRSHFVFQKWIFDCKFYLLNANAIKMRNSSNRKAMTRCRVSQFYQMQFWLWSRFAEFFLKKFRAILSWISSFQRWKWRDEMIVAWLSKCCERKTKMLQKMKILHEFLLFLYIYTIEWNSFISFRMNFLT